MFETRDLLRFPISTHHSTRQRPASHGLVPIEQRHCVSVVESAMVRKRYRERRCDTCAFVAHERIRMSSCLNDDRRLLFFCRLAFQID